MRSTSQSGSLRIATTVYSKIAGMNGAELQLVPIGVDYAVYKRVYKPGTPDELITTVSYWPYKSFRALAGGQACDRPGPRGLTVGLPRSRFEPRGVCRYKLCGCPLSDVAAARSRYPRAERALYVVLIRCSPNVASHFSIVLGISP